MLLTHIFMTATFILIMKLKLRKIGTFPLPSLLNTRLEGQSRHYGLKDLAVVHMAPSRS